MILRLPNHPKLLLPTGYQRVDIGCILLGSLPQVSDLILLSKNTADSKKIMANIEE